MSKTKIIVTASAAAICAVGMTAAAIVVCRKLFEKNYFTVSNENNQKKVESNGNQIYKSRNLKG